MSLRIYDVGGRLVRMLDSGLQSAGDHRATWDGLDDEGRQVRNGVYFARLASAGEERRIRLIRMR